MISKLCLVFVVAVVTEISGHGMMLQPAGRSSVWRFNPAAPKNYNDNQNYCGGSQVQNELLHGKCGVCGDRYDAPHPQDNENTGAYGKGIVVATYKPGEVIDVLIKLTANHLGTFTYSLCKLRNPNAPESGEKCFKPLKLQGGSKTFGITADMKEIHNKVVLPKTTCDRCVLRWTYRGGNNWGTCDDGSQRAGCGPQEHFRSCADIAIRS